MKYRSLQYFISTMHKHKNKGKVIRFEDVELLQERIQKESPKSGQYFYDYKLEEAEKEAAVNDEEEFHKIYKINFTDLPISQSTVKGLNNRGFTKMTEVQRCSIPHALADRDLLVSSKTGSGKTLAYLIPLVQKLYRHKFIPMDGLGAVVIVPVRELAMQVFEVLNSFTEKMEISVGLIIGGKDVKYEQERINLMNILVCTPGRLLQHLQETYGFQTANLQMLVLDEADVMLEMGFREHLQTILEYLPRVQTLLYSATMTRDILSLANICTSNPQKILLQGVSAHKEENDNKIGRYEAPSKLTQYYMVVNPQDKINTFYSFLKSHPKQKIVVFLSTCKQVRFLYEAFRKFKLGSPLYELQGHQKQKKRMAIYFTFCQKKYGVLLCTNIAARGIDFPHVDWVLQIDAPDQPDTYVHRVGRTARYRAEGRSLLLLSENEVPLVEDLKTKNIQIHKITQNPQRYLRVDSSLQSICSEHQDVKYLAQRALISYLRFLYKSGNKKIFDIRKINLETLSRSYGLPSAPVINFKIPQPDDEEDQEDEQQPKLTKIQKLRLNQKMKKSALKEAKIKEKKQEQIFGEVEEQEEEEDIKRKFTHKGSSHDDDLLVVKGVVRNEGEKVPLTTSKSQLKKIKPQGHFQGKNKVYFDQDGNAITADKHRIKQRLSANREDVDYDAIQTMQERLEQNKLGDDEVERERRKARRKKKDQAKEIARKGGVERQAVLEVEEEEDQEDLL